MHIKRCFIFVLLFFAAVLVSAQTAKYVFSHLDINQGLSHNRVNCVFKDSSGFIWLGTMAGLDRFDGSSIRAFKHENSDTSSILDNYTISITADHFNKLWINTRSGYVIFDPENEVFSTKVPKYLSKCIHNLSDIQRLYLDPHNNFWIITTNGKLFRCKTNSSNVQLILNSNKPEGNSNWNITSIISDNTGDLWIIFSNGIIEQFDGKTFKVKYKNSYIKDNFGNQTRLFDFYIDSDNDLWIYSTGELDGILYLNNYSKVFEQYTVRSGNYRLNNNLIRNVIEEKPGRIWIGTDHGGINIIDKRNRKIEYILNQPEEEKSLSQNVINAMYKDNTGIIWVGTYKKGVNYYHPNQYKFSLITHKVSDPSSLPTDDINCFAEDKKGNLWIGTNNAGIIYYDRLNEKFTSYRNNPNNTNSLSSDVIVKLYIDKSNLLWIGTYMGGLDCFDGVNFKHFLHTNDPNSISNNAIWEILEDSKKNFWIGTLSGGLNLFDRDKNIFYHYRAGDANSVTSNFITALVEDKFGNLWIGTDFGISVLEKSSGKFSQYFQNISDSASLSSNYIFCIIADRKGNMWAGTRDGLNVFDCETREIKKIRTNNGLPDNSVLTLLEDENGNIWMSTPNGISNLIISNKSGKNFSYHIVNYDKSDGLQGKDFNERAAFRTHKGELLFGGANGFNIINPNKIIVDSGFPKVVLTSLNVFNRPIKVGEVLNGRMLLNHSLNNVKSIVLKYNENVFSIDFAALNFLNPEKIKYRYKLEGFNVDWLNVDEKQNRATYTNLDPGEYTFIVKASNENEVWNTTGTKLKIVVLPPFWRTKTAILIYVIILLVIILLSRKILLDRARMEFLVEHERNESLRTHELDMMKIKFFTNISHEFRTPLSLILAPIEKLLQTSKESEQEKQLILIQRNAKRLLNLVNQLLDFRKMEVQEFKLKPVNDDIVAFVKDITISFSDISDKNHVNLNFDSNTPEFIASFDRDKLEKIMFNLLSNAFKFTNGGGKVSVELEIKKCIGDSAINGLIEIRVRDTGIGISADKHDKIFEQFFQNETPGNILNQGSGIGLAITKEFVRLHNGTIRVESEPDKGSCFIVQIPVLEYFEIENKEIAEEVVKTEQIEVTDDNLLKDLESFQILIVEDNEDLRFYLKDNLSTKYKIAEASNGKEALKIAFNSIPDIIITDIMMPEMNGIEFCKFIKNDKRTSHVPVIMLTARTADEQKLEGYESGADGYITKPFSFEILESRIRNVISQRESLRKKFQKHFEVNPTEINITSLDEKLIQRALELVEKNISNADFSVEELSRELGMSRVHLYKKLLTITGKSPIEFIRIIRLKRAAKLLFKSQLSVSEIAYEVGFNNPKYFSKYFKEEFKVLPSQYHDSSEI